MENVDLFEERNARVLPKIIFGGTSASEIQFSSVRNALKGRGVEIPRWGKHRCPSSSSWQGFTVSQTKLWLRSSASVFPCDENILELKFCWLLELLRGKPAAFAKNHDPHTRIFLESVSAAPSMISLHTNKYE